LKACQPLLLFSSGVKVRIGGTGSGGVVLLVGGSDICCVSRVSPVTEAVDEAIIGTLIKFFTRYTLKIE
jgi:hypothetical protein